MRFFLRLKFSEITANTLNKSCFCSLSASFKTIFIFYFDEKKIDIQDSKRFYCDVVLFYVGLVLKLSQHKQV